MNNVSSLSLILLSLALGFFLGKPLWADVTSLSAKQAEYESALESIRSLQDSTANLKNELEGLALEERNAIMTLIPQSPDTVKFVADVDAVARGRGVAIDSIDHTSANADTNGSIAGAAPRQSYESVTISIRARASYAALKGFLSDLESSLRIVDIQEINVETGEGNIYTYTIKAVVYWMPSLTNEML